MIYLHTDPQSIKPPPSRVSMRLTSSTCDLACKRGSTCCSDPHSHYWSPLCFRVPFANGFSATFQGSLSPQACGSGPCSPTPLPALRGLDIAPRQRSGMASPSTILAHKEFVWSSEQVAAASRRSSSGDSSERCMHTSQAVGHHRRRCPDGERDRDAEFYFLILVALVVLRFLPCSLQGCGSL